ncbi:hypothetical protein CsSME_00007815 [Camellia sinensis var. sinensis]
MDSFSAPSSASSSQMTPENLMDQLKTQLAQAYAEEFLQTVRGKCFEKCITKPGSSLSGSESSCTSRCVDRYIEATVINKVGELSKSAKTSSKALWSCLKVWENSKNILKPFAVNDRGNGHLLIGKKKMILLDCIADLSSKT